MFAHQALQPLKHLPSLALLYILEILTIPFWLWQRAVLLTVLGDDSMHLLENSEVRSKCQRHLVRQI